MAIEQVRYELDSSPTPPVLLEERSLVLGEEREFGVPVHFTVPGPMEYPVTVLLGHLQSGAFHVLKAIPVKVEKSDEGFTASWIEIDEFGYGDTPAEAIHDFRRSLASLHRSLKQDESRLGNDLRRVWLKLQEHVIPTR